MDFKQRRLLVRKLENIMQEINEGSGGKKSMLQAEKLIFCAARILQKGDLKYYEKKAGD